MQNINIVKKTKVRKLYMLETVDELNSLDFNKLIDMSRKKGSLEITFSERENILKVDYITELTTNKENKTEVEKYGRNNRRQNISKDEVSS